MTAFNYMGVSEDGRQYKFSNDSGASFSAYVPDSLHPMLQAMAPGTRIDAVIEQKTSSKGNTYTQVKQINGQVGRKDPNSTPGGGAPKPTGYNDKRFCEAVCAAAVTSGQIKSPADLAKWAAAAYSAISTVQAVAIKETLNAGAAAPANPAPSVPDQPLNDAIPF